MLDPGAQKVSSWFCLFRSFDHLSSSLAESSGRLSLCSSKWSPVTPDWNFYQLSHPCEKKEKSFSLKFLPKAVVLTLLHPFWPYIHPWNIYGAWKDELGWGTRWDHMVTLDQRWVQFHPNQIGWAIVWEGGGILGRKTEVLFPNDEKMVTIRQEHLFATYTFLLQF